MTMIHMYIYDIYLNMSTTVYAHIYTLSTGALYTPLYTYNINYVYILYTLHICTEYTTFIGPTKAGWLKKECSDNHTISYILPLPLLPYNRYIKRWFVLKDMCLYYFIYPSDKKPRCIIPLDGLVVTRASTRTILLTGRENGKMLKFGRFVPASILSKGGAVYESRERLLLKAATETECYDWYVCMAYIMHVS